MGYYSLMGNAVYYSRWMVKADIPAAIPLSVTNEGIPCFSKKELEKVEALLKRRGIDYTVEELPEPPGFSVTRNEDGSPKKYASRSEALRHIEQGIEPESMTIPRLRERVVAAEERANIAELKAEQAKAQIADALSRAQQAENILASMETRLKQVEEKSGISSKK